MSGRAPKRIRPGLAPGNTSPGASEQGYQLIHRMNASQSAAWHSNRETEGESLHVPNQSVQQETTIGHPPQGRTLLPPLPASRAMRALLAAKTDKNRTLHACDKCRKSKAKCSGGQPCDKCGLEGKDCVYGAGKRDLERKEVERLQHLNEKLLQREEKLSQRNEQLINAILNFSSDLGPSRRRELEEIAMSQTPGSDEADAEETIDRNSDTRDSDKHEMDIQGEEDADADVGSPGSLDVINEDTNRDEHTRAAGFMGKSSAVTWVQRAKKAALNDFEDERHFRRSLGTDANGSFTDATYHAEPGDFPTVQTDEVNALEWPPPALSKALVDAYFDNVHVSLPMLSKSDFYQKFETFPKDQITKEDQSWLAMANLVFAIGAKFAHITNAYFKGDDRDHLIYYARARALGLDHRTLNEDPDLEHTTCLGILGLYLLSTDRLNRAWTICGIAVRHAMALGLHVRSEAKDLSDMDKELRVRLWWSLYCLERLLDEITGRPSCISDSALSTPLPLNVNESDFRRDSPLYNHQPERSITSPKVRDKPQLATQQIPTPVASSSASVDPSRISVSPMSSSMTWSYTFSISRLPITSSTYFIYRTQLSIISHEILARLYCATLVKVKWIEVQDIIRNIDSRLLNWKANLPEELDFSYPYTKSDAFALYKTGLSMFYFSSRMILFRTCLCRFEGRIENESERSKTFDSNAAITCVESARKLLASLPSNYESVTAYTTTPWWNVVHYIVEAGSVLMLELAYRADHVPSQAQEILADSKKTVLWLRAMSGQSIAARKSWEIFHSLLQVVAPKVGGETSDMPGTAPIPLGWRWNRFGTQDKQNHNQQQGNHLVSQAVEPYPAYPSRMDEWVNKSSYNNEQMRYSAPTFTGPPDAQSSATSVIPSFLMGLYPFNEMYGRYDEYGPIRMQNPYFPNDVMQGDGTYPSTTTYVSQEEIVGGLTGQQSMIPQLTTLGQVPLGGDISGYGAAGPYDLDAGVPGTEYVMGEFRNWNDVSTTGDGGAG